MKRRLVQLSLVRGPRAPTITAAATAAMLAASPAIATPRPDCPVQVTSTNNPVPIPALVSVRASTPMTTARDGSRASADTVTVLGGDQANGIVTIDLTYATEIASGCTVPTRFVPIWARNQEDVERGSPLLEREIARWVDGYINDRMVNASVDRMMQAVGNGTRTIRIQVPFQAIEGRNDRRGQFRIYHYGDSTSRPITVDVDPLPLVALVGPTAPVRPGDAVPLEVRAPLAMLEETLDMPVTVAVVPATLGRVSVPLASPASAASVTGRWQVSVNPVKVVARFDPADVPADTSGEIRVTFAGQTVSAPVSVVARPRCQPKFVATAVRGGFAIALYNQGKLACPAFTVSPGAGTGAAQSWRYGQGKVTLKSAAVNQTVPVQSATLASPARVPATTTIARAAAPLTSAQGAFLFVPLPAALPVGTAVRFTAQSVDGSIAPVGFSTVLTADAVNTIKG